MFHIQGIRTPSVLGPLLISAPEATFAEIIPGCTTTSPSSPHVPARVITSSNFVVQCRPERRNIPSFVFGFQPSSHS